MSQRLSGCTHSDLLADVGSKCVGLTLTSRVSGSDDASFIGFRIHLFRVGFLVGFLVEPGDMGCKI